MEMAYSIADGGGFGDYQVQRETFACAQRLPLRWSQSQSTQTQQVCKPSYEPSSLQLDNPCYNYTTKYEKNIMDFSGKDAH